MRVSPFAFRYQGNGATTCQYIDTTRKAFDCAKTLPLTVERQLIDSLYIMKLCSRLFVLYCRSRPKDDKSRHFDPHFEEVRGDVEPWSMARCLQEWVGHLEPKFQGDGGIFFGFYKTRHILLYDSANCTVLRAVVLTQYRRVTNRRTDRRNCRS